MKIIEKNFFKVKVKENKYKENFDLELIWKNKINYKKKDILKNYNLVEVFIIEVKKPKWILKE